MQLLELHEFLEEKVARYNNPNFIESDPILIPHSFTLKEDIEIAGFLAATIAWGNRKMIIQNAKKIMDLMGNAPYDFILSHTTNDLERLDNFVHRTFNGQDLTYFVKALSHLYSNHQGLEGVFSRNQEPNTMQNSIAAFKKVFFEIEHSVRTEKHISDPWNNSAAKRINMFLRWMCRKDQKGVDFGIWESIPMSILSCPLDVHSGNVARKLGLLHRKQNDAKALQELDTNLRLLDPKDPIKYDFALFGLGVFEKF